MAEKRTEQLKVMVGETTLRRIQDAATDDDRAVSDWIRHHLELVLDLRDGGFRLQRGPKNGMDGEST